MKILASITRVGPSRWEASVEVGQTVLSDWVERLRAAFTTPQFVAWEVEIDAARSVVTIQTPLYITELDLDQLDKALYEARPRA